MLIAITSIYCYSSVYYIIQLSCFNFAKKLIDDFKLTIKRYFMKKITLLLVMLLSSITGYSQFSEGFETEIPASFTVNNGGSANGWVHSTAPTGGAHTGSGVARIVYNTDAHNDDLITPQMTIASGVNDRLSFWIKSRSASFLEPYQVLLSTTDTATGSFTVTLQAEQEVPNSWENIEVDLTVYVG